MKLKNNVSSLFQQTMMKRKDINQADLVGEKKSKITQDYDFLKEIGSGIISI